MCIYIYYLVIYIYLHFIKMTLRVNVRSFSLFYYITQNAVLRVSHVTSGTGEAVSFVSITSS